MGKTPKKEKIVNLITPINLHRDHFEKTAYALSECMKYVLQQSKKNGFLTTAQLLEVALVTIKHDYIEATLQQTITAQMFRKSREPASIHRLDPKPSADSDQ